MKSLSKLKPKDRVIYVTDKGLIFVGIIGKKSTKCGDAIQLRIPFTRELFDPMTGKSNKSKAFITTATKKQLAIVEKEVAERDKGLKIRHVSVIKPVQKRNTGSLTPLKA